MNGFGVYPIYERFHKDEDDIVNNAGNLFWRLQNRWICLKRLFVYGNRGTLWAVAVTMRPKSFRASRGHNYILYV